MIRIKIGKKFDNQYLTLVNKNPELKEIALEKIKLFRSNHQDTRLRNHSLTKRLEGKWAFSITSDIRIVYEWTGQTTIRLLGIGLHRDVYQNPRT
jgi:addiction module RelE/StbE family toxin